MQRLRGSISLAWLAVLLAHGAVGCDSRASATATGAGAPAPRPSLEYESCGTSAHCADGLRCFAQTCARTARHPLGDYHAAFAQAEDEAGRVDSALAAWAVATAAYQDLDLTMPPDLDCAYGRTLAAARRQPEKAELAARFLHRCMLGVPVGSPLWRTALADAHLLEDVGFDPSHLAKDAPVDVYLSKVTTRPDASKLTIAYKAEPNPTAKTFPAVITRLGAADVRSPLLECWQTHFELTRNATASATVAVRSRYVTDPDYDDSGRYVVTLGDDAGATGFAACARAAIVPALKKVDGLRDAFVTNLTLTVE